MRKTVQEAPSDIYARRARQVRAELGRPRDETAEEEAARTKPAAFSASLPDGGLAERRAREFELAKTFRGRQILEDERVRDYFASTAALRLVFAGWGKTFEGRLMSEADRVKVLKADPQGLELLLREEARARGKGDAPEPPKKGGGGAATFSETPEDLYARRARELGGA